MNTQLGQRRLVPVLVILLAVVACAGGSADRWTDVAVPSQDRVATGPAPVLRITGTVRYIAVEGGQFVIADATGMRFNPTNLPRDFRTDGILVEADARRR